MFRKLVRCEQGDRVLLEELVDATELNGLEGTVIEWCEPKGRFVVRMDTREAVYVRRENLVRRTRK